MTKSKDNLSNIHIDDMWKWHYVENTINSVMHFFNYTETRPPILLSNEVIHKIYDVEGHNSDKSQDKLYQINSDEKLSLRPDGTVTYLSEFYSNDDLSGIKRIYYIGAMFRRNALDSFFNGQFHQFGAEVLGSDSYITDIEIIRLGLSIFKRFGLKNVKLEINGFGCDECRPIFMDKIRQFWDSVRSKLCTKCAEDHDYYLANADKCHKCKQFLKKSPVVNEFLCDQCYNNFTHIKKALANLMIDYTVNPHLKMNFDYYNQVVFQFIIDTDKGQIVLGGGGRYDNLAKSITGKDLPAIGFSSNIEVLISVLDEKNLFPIPENDFKVFVLASDHELEFTLLQIVQELHEHEIRVVVGKTDPNHLQQKKIASQEGCSIMIVLDDIIIREGKVIVHNLVKNYREDVDLKDIMISVLRLKKAISNNKT
jgi:histidyl-tRNA synthetase